MARWLVDFDLDDEDSSRLETLTQHLLADLRELGVVRVDRVRGAGADGAKSGAAVEIGRLVLSGAFSATGAAAFARVMVARFEKAKCRSVSIEKDGEKYELAALSVADQHTLVEAIAARLRDDSSAEDDSPTPQQ